MYGADHCIYSRADALSESDVRVREFRPVYDVPCNVHLHSAYTTGLGGGQLMKALPEGDSRCTVPDAH